MDYQKIEKYLKTLGKLTVCRDRFSETPVINVNWTQFVKNCDTYGTTDSTEIKETGLRSIGDLYRMWINFEDISFENFVYKIAIELNENELFQSVICKGINRRTYGYDHGFRLQYTGELIDEFEIDWKPLLEEHVFTNPNDISSYGIFHDRDDLIMIQV